MYCFSNVNNTEALQLPTWNMCVWSVGSDIDFILIDIKFKSKEEEIKWYLGAVANHRVIC